MHHSINASIKRSLDFIELVLERTNRFVERTNHDLEQINLTLEQSDPVGHEGIFVVVVVLVVLVVGGGGVPFSSTMSASLFGLMLWAIGHQTGTTSTCPCFIIGNLVLIKTRPATTLAMCLFTFFTTCSDAFCHFTWWGG